MRFFYLPRKLACFGSSFEYNIYWIIESYFLLKKVFVPSIFCQTRRLLNDLSDFEYSSKYMFCIIL